MEPDTYRYTLESRCGERDFIGAYAISVANGEVVEVAALDASAKAYLGRGGDVPTIAGLLDLAEQARHEGADEVTTDYPDGAPEGEGPPSALTIDRDADAIDDEECYTISDYTPAA
ncbi:hypothetical protein DEH69_04280 [Streptomyces sp. PT12]|nr:hypothetical protein DEH69_04280 [Streptomyces sp. PT12]